MGKRTVVVFISFCVLFSFLVTRLGILVKSDYLINASEIQTSKIIKVAEVRANIYDKNLDKLVNEETGYKATFLPTPQNVDSILEELNLSNRGLILDNMKTQSPVIVGVDKSSFYSNDIEIFEIPKRYSDQQLASHIVGYTNGENQGVSGIEKSFNNFLLENKSNMEISYYRNGLGKSIQGAKPNRNKYESPKAGVVLTIDKSIQKIVEKIGNKYIKKGAITILDPYTGQIISCASFPSYNQNEIEKSISDEANAPMINRALSNYSVGSTFKIVIVAAALESGIDKNYTFNCTGAIDVKGQRFRCHEEKGHGVLNMESALVESCNPYFIDISNKINSQKIISVANKLGFEKQYTLSEGLTTSKGFLPTAKDLINPAEVANLSFGQGKVLANSIQIAQMVSSIINQGKTPAPSLIKGFSMDSKTLYKTEQSLPHMISMSKETANSIKKMLVDSVMKKYNQQAKPKLISAGGKTSTAQTGVVVDDEELLQTWFAGFFPAENPKYVAVILAEDGETGNATAGPIFSEIADEIFILEK